MNDKNKEILKSAVRMYLSVESSKVDKQTIIEKLKSQVAIFEKLLRQAKVERQSPCAKTLDMRGKVPAECQEFEYHGRLHWLDKKSKAILLESCKLYQGIITRGVFEDIVYASHTYQGQELRKQLQFFQFMPQQKRINKLKYPDKQKKLEAFKSNGKKPEIIPLGYYLFRQHARVQFESLVEVFVAGKHYQMRTKDISIDGVKLVAKQGMHFHYGQEVQITYRQVNEENACEFIDVPYQVSSIESGYRRLLIGLQIQYSSASDKMAEYVAALLADLLKTTDGRRMIDYEDAILSAESLVNELLYTHSSSLVPLLIAQLPHGDLYCLDLCLTHANREILKPFYDISGNYRFSFIYESDFLAIICQRSRASDLIDLVFAAESVSELDDVTEIIFQDAFENEYDWYAYVCKNLDNPGFRVYKVEARRCSQLNKKRIEQGIADLSRRALATSQQLLQALEQVVVVAYFVDISDLYKSIDYSLAYKSQQVTKPNTVYASSVGDDAQKFSVTSLDFFSLMLESENLLELDVQIQLDNKLYTGQAKLSTLAEITIYIKQQVLNANCSDTVLLGFPQLQEQVEDNIDLQALPYLIVGTDISDISVLKLRRIRNASTRQIDEFFKELIEINSVHFNKALSDTVLAAKSRIYSAMISDTLSSIPFSIYHNEVYQRKSIKINVPVNQPALADFFTVVDGELDFSAFSDSKCLDYLCHRLEQSATVSINYFVYKKKNPETNQLELYAASDLHFKRITQCIEFIEQALKYDYRFLRLNASHAYRPDGFVIENVFNAVLAKKETHQASKIKADLDKVVASGEIIDITSCFYNYYCAVKQKLQARSA